MEGMKICEEIEVFRILGNTNIHHLRNICRLFVFPGCWFSVSNRKFPGKYKSFSSFNVMMTVSLNLQILVFVHSFSFMNITEKKT